MVYQILTRLCHASDRLPTHRAPTASLCAVWGGGFGQFCRDRERSVLRHPPKRRQPRRAKSKRSAPYLQRLRRVPLVLVAAIAPLLVSGCSQSDNTSSIGRPLFTEKEYGVSSSPRVVKNLGPVPKGGGVRKLGTPYRVAGKLYVPREDRNYDATGRASWYGYDFHGRKTANGEIFDSRALTAAHPTLPMPSYAYVTNLENDRTVLVRINDRGPYVGGRIIDLSEATATALGYKNKGTARVRVRYAGPAPLNGSDHHERRFLAAQAWSGRGAHRASALGGPRTRAREPRRSLWSPTDYRAALADK